MVVAVMAASKSEKKKAKRKAKLKQQRVKKTLAVQRMHRGFLLEEAAWLRGMGEYQEALAVVQNVLRQMPGNEAALREMLMIGQALKQPDLEFSALEGLHRCDRLPDFMRPAYCEHLLRHRRFQDARRAAEEGLALLPQADISGKRAIRQFYTQLLNLPQGPPGEDRRGERPKPASSRPKKKAPPAAAADAVPLPAAEPEPSKPAPVIPPVPVTFAIDDSDFTGFLECRSPAALEDYELALEAHQIRLKETFDRLICLGRLKHIQSFPYQEETARKVLRRFCGRALLADEVGLGKTIEAATVLKEYIERGMVKSAIILTPASLVGQWQEELRDKFSLDFPSTENPLMRAAGDALWQEPFLVASINQAKSRRNYSQVAEREYDLVIVDEAHHLKNRNTLNWKLVNDLKKRFLLLLTATPVENNLMELYNLITLLKPGQLKTAGEFRREFMTRGDPTDPQNRARLRELLSEVMIRNTRSVARIDIPPRFAQTVRVEPGPLERELYERITALVQGIREAEGGASRLLLKTLMEEAGSSPRAVESTLKRLLGKNDSLVEQEGEIRAIGDLCRSLENSRKNMVLLELVRSCPDKMIVFVKYQETLRYISDFLAREKVAHALYYGGLSGAQKKENIRRFEADTPVLLATEVGGEGRNLQFCHRLVNYDLPWNPMQIEQRIGRLHRIGQRHEVLIFNFCGAGSAEDYILEILDKKINMFEMIIGEIDMILGRTRSEQEFSDLVLDIWMKAAGPDERKHAFAQLGSQVKRLKSGYEKTKALDKKLFGDSFEL
jgi:superfamily II DNA or RNA helicase